MQELYERLYNIRCAQYMDYEWELLESSVGAIKHSPDGFRVIYDPYNDPLERLNIVNRLYFQNKFNYEDYDLEIKEHGVQDAIRLIIGDCLISEEDRWVLSISESLGDNAINDFFSRKKEAVDKSSCDIYENCCEPTGAMLKCGDPLNDYKYTDSPLTLVGYIDDGEFHETPATRRHDDDYWAARLMVLGNYRQATGNVYVNGSWEYIVEVEPRRGDIENEVVQYDENMAQAVFLEEYIRNESYYKDTLWQEAVGLVNKPDDDELNPESVYNWRLEILRECLRLLSISAVDNSWIPVEFNDLCMKIAEVYCISWADNHRDDWNPYDNEEQLKWVFDVVVNYADVSFIMHGDINGGLKQVNLDDSMRNYIFENGRSILHD